MLDPFSMTLPLWHPSPSLHSVSTHSPPLTSFEPFGLYTPTATVNPQLPQSPRSPSYPQCSPSCLHTFLTPAPRRRPQFVLAWWRAFRHSSRRAGGAKAWRPLVQRVPPHPGRLSQAAGTGREGGAERSPSPARAAGSEREVHRGRHLVSRGRWGSGGARAGRGPSWTYHELQKER